MPRQDLRHPGGPRGHRRHLGPVPLSRHPLGLRHVHAGLLVQAVDRGQGDRRRPVDPATMSARPPPRTASTSTSASAIGSSAPPGRRRTRAGRWRPNAGRAKAAEIVRFTCNFLFMCSGYYNYAGGYTPEFPGARRLRGPHRPSAALAGRPRLCRQAGGGDRLAAPPP